MNIVLLVIGVVAAILGIIIRVLTKDTDYEKDGKHYAHPMIIGGLILLVFSQSFAIIPTGYTGVRITFGQIDNRTVQNGFNWKIPFVQSINQVNNKQQDISYAHMILSLYYRRWESHRIFWISFNLKGENMSSFVLKSILIKNYHGMSGSFKIVDNIMPYTSNIMLSASQVLLSTYFKAFSTYIPDKYTIMIC